MQRGLFLYCAIVFGEVIVRAPLVAASTRPS